MKHEIVFSYLAISLLKQVKNISKDGIVYKFFKTTNEIIKTQHIVDRTVFTVNDIAYIVRSSLHNYNKTYSAQKHSLVINKLLLILVRV
ncbi:hypothetical protein C0J27_01290 [Candidatus Chromulinivorax destructor]|uniref:Uncharacterized protein n=1 Tax=Candidatus Chromulinivorax destructor TaxID=2066483 RepID=A0A345ZAR7_9BACT|nr:hypothetical protein C0J27_01290 [Candidatus Chromulinivorax destructor]